MNTDILLIILMIYEHQTQPGTYTTHGHQANQLTRPSKILTLRYRDHKLYLYDLYLQPPRMIMTYMNICLLPPWTFVDYHT